MKGKIYAAAAAATLLACAVGMAGCEVVAGPTGKSAYDVAVENGFTGTKEEWLESLKGQGGAAETGTVWLTGKGAPKDSVTANDGDYYVDTVTNRLYRYEGKSWNAVGTVNDVTRLSVWDGTIPGWQAPYLTDEEAEKNRPASYLVNETEKTIGLYDAEAFAWFAYSAVMGSNGFAGYTVNLYSDIDLNDHMWIPVGNGGRSYEPDQAFAGTFDGHGHTIYNLNGEGYYDAIEYGEYTVYDSAEESHAAEGYFVHYSQDTELYGAVEADIPVAITNEGEYNYGLFGATENATIRNLNLKNVKIDLTAKEIEGNGESVPPHTSVIGDSVGALVGYAGGSLIVENCTAGSEHGGTEVDYIVGASCSGGLVGRAYGGSNPNAGGKANRGEPFCEVVLKNCKNYLTIVCEKYGEKSGGIIGYPAYFSALTIEDCENYGSVAAYYAGGMYGFRGMGTVVDGSAVTVSRCVNRGAITGAYAGGLIGHRINNNVYTFMRFEFCENYGDIAGENTFGGTSKTVYAGGLFGGFSVGKEQAILYNCFNYGEVSVDETLSTVAVTKICAGGLFGNFDVKNEGKLLAYAVNDGAVAVTHKAATALSSIYAGGVFGEKSASTKLSTDVESGANVTVLFLTSAKQADVKQAETE